MVDPRPMEEDDSVYRCLVVDSGPIIRLTGISSLWKKAKAFYTVPAVLQEIRDAKARHHLDNLPFELNTKEPSSEAVKAIISFARQTGDYQSLSTVDIHVLALVYDLEKEGCFGDVSHVRTVPKRMVGVGKIATLGVKKTESTTTGTSVVASDGTAVEGDDSEEEEDDDHDDDDSQESEEEDEEPVIEKNDTTNPPAPSAPRSWAALVNPTAVASSIPVANSAPAVTSLSTSLAKMKVSPPETATCGQFSDAEEEEDEIGEVVKTDLTEKAPRNVEDELELEFPSLAAAASVPYEGDVGKIDEEERKRRSLQPVSKSGKLYNSVPVAKKLARRDDKPTAPKVEEEEAKKPLPEPESEIRDNTQSRIMGGANMSGQQEDVEDDGEGWITTPSEIQSLKANGALDPTRCLGGLGTGNQRPPQPLGPPIFQRAACTTTDFAMQNVLLQMGLELLSVDGMKIKKIKSWVRRCGACFKVYTDAGDMGPISGKRLFCERCGSDMIQRIACSVDGKSGRIRVHLKKNYKHNLRGTKYSLPKPGSGDRFQGDLLLREDQLLMGTWAQKAKMLGGGKANAASESIFGRDIAKNMGCHVNSMSGDDIQVGFGRRNPNAAKGRERRGKKKKTPTKACGLRRY